MKDWFKGLRKMLVNLGCVGAITVIMLSGDGNVDNSELAALALIAGLGGYHNRLQKGIDDNELAK